MGALGIGGAAIGFDFHFGKSRAGSPSFLAEQGALLGFAVDVAPPLEDEGRPVSSGAVRAALAAGRVVRPRNFWARHGSFPVRSFTVTSAVASSAFRPPT